MTGLKFHTSNRLERLAGALAHSLDTPLKDPLAQEIIVVQSRGMARWASLQLAQISGVCMGCDFPFPRVFVERTLRAFFPAMADTAEFSPGAMAWKIHALLPGLARRREFAPVRNYLDGDEGLKAFQLSEKIARLFDQYLVYRPDMLLRWERDQSDKQWQAALWREIAGKKKTQHLAAISQSLEERMGEMFARGEVPERVSVFGVSSLPPLYLRVFIGLARHCAVNFFSLEPSREYFAHDLPAGRRARLARRRGEDGDAEQGTGNPVLSSLGKLNRDFTDLRIELNERAGFVMDEQPDDFVEQADDSMLGVIQGDILRARNRGGDDAPKAGVVPGDRSIQIHACHSPMREMEVLYDQLLDLFQKDPSLKPRDIVVMAPDIEKYSPFIHAVFAFPEESARAIPFSVADRIPSNESASVAAFLALLELPGRRCTATEIYSLLDRPPVRARFGFSGADMDLIRRWIAETGIRWGIDGAHREEFGVPGLEASTWREGFRRLLLGYAMPGGDRRMFEGTMPYDDIEGSGTEVMGRFVDAVEALFEVAAELPKERPLADWAGALDAVVKRFFLARTSAEAGELRFIQDALDELREVARISDGAQVADFAAVRLFLGQLLDDAGRRGGFFTGGVTFCALKPMRSIPARVVCLIGMDDNAFPKRAGAPAFDLMAREPRCGDRSPRDDDRFSFLEAIISARGHLYVSYLGRSIIDNAELPPSVLVSELLDCMDKTFVFPDGQEARASVVAAHRLHAFSRRYFDGSDDRIFSYSGANAAASRNLQMQSTGKIESIVPMLPEPEAVLRNVSLHSLVDFFSHPAKYFTRERLGIRFEEDGEVLEDNEIFELNDLEKYHLKQDLVAQALEQRTANAGEFAARGLLPLGGVGEARFNTLNGGAVDFARNLETELGGRSPDEPAALDLRIGEFSLTGRIGSLYGDRIVVFRFAKLKPQDRLRVWIHHLAKCASSKDPATLVGDGETARFAPVADAAGVLAGLLEIYWRGLCAPPHFFPGSSYAYAKAEMNPSKRKKTTSISHARKKWEVSDWTKSGEKGDAYNEFCFGTIDPLDADFTMLALEVFGPMLRHMTSQK